MSTADGAAPGRASARPGATRTVREAGQEFSTLVSLVGALTGDPRGHLLPEAAGADGAGHLVGAVEAEDGVGVLEVSADSLSIGLFRLLMSRPLLALAQPPPGVAAGAQVLPQTSVDRWFWNACTSWRSLERRHELAATGPA